MADRGRDFKVSILSDTNRFRTSDAADQLDDLADAAQDAGRALDDVQPQDAVRGLDRIADAAQDADKALDKIDGRAAGRELDQAGKAAVDARKDLDKLGDEAAAVAARVDGAFDKIAASAKTKIADPVEHGAHRASESVAEFKDEAKQNLSEVASSFQGDITSAVDLVQGTLGGLASSLGPIGAAIGALGAVGVGVFAQRMQQAKQDAQDLIGALIEGGGRLAQQNIFDKIRTFAEDGTLARIRRDADLTGVSFSDLAAAYAGDADALDRVLPKLQAAKQAMQDQAGAVDGAGQANDEFAASLYQTTSDLEDQQAKNRDATDAVAGYTDATRQAAAAAEQQQKAEEAKAAALDETRGLIEQQGTALDVYQGLVDEATTKEQERAQAVADGTKDSKDKWEDYAKQVDVSIDQVNQALAEQVQATADWSGNLRELARRGVDDGVLAQLARMGPEGAPLVAKLTKASDAELSKYVGLAQQRAQQGTDAFIQSLLDGIPGVADAAAQQKRALVAALGGDIPVTVKFRGDAVDFYRTLEDVKRAAATGVNVQAKYAAMERTVP